MLGYCMTAKRYIVCKAAKSLAAKASNADLLTNSYYIEAY